MDVSRFDGATFLEHEDAATDCQASGGLPQKFDFVRVDRQIVKRQSLRSRGFERRHDPFFTSTVRSPHLLTPARRRTVENIVPVTLPFLAP